MHASQLQMADLQSTIGKYRELVQTLQYENASLNQLQTGEEAKSSVVDTMDSIEMKTKLSESKIQSKVSVMLSAPCTHVFTITVEAITASVSVL